MCWRRVRVRLYGLIKRLLFQRSGWPRGCGRRGARYVVECGELVAGRNERAHIVGSAGGEGRGTGCPRGAWSVAAEDVAGVYFGLYIVEHGVVAVGYDYL